MFKRAHDLSPSWARRIPPTPFHCTSLKYILILSSPLFLWIGSGLLLQVSPSKPCKHFLPSRMHATHPAQLIILDVMTLVFSVEIKSWSYSLCYFLQLPAISSLLGPNILLRFLLTESLAHTFFLYYERPAFTLIQYNRQRNVSLQCNVFDVKSHTVKTKYSRSVGSLRSLKDFLHVLLTRWNNTSLTFAIF